MKKTLLTMAAALSLVGCSKSELVETPIQEQNAISFGTYVGHDAQTRATIVDLDVVKLKGFGVNAYYNAEYADDGTFTYASVFMDNTKVTYSDEKGAWTYSPIKYWPNNADDHITFFAYAPYDHSNPGLGAGNADMSKIYDFTVAENVRDQIDLVYHKAFGEDGLKGTGDNGETYQMKKQNIYDMVQFNFQHALSRISFDVKAVVDDINDESDNLLDGNTRINIKRVALVGETDAENGPFYTAGTLDMSTGEWSFEDDVVTRIYDMKGEDFYRPVLENDEYVAQLSKFNPSQRLLDDEEYLMILPQEFEVGNGYRIYIEYDVISEEVDNNSVNTNTTEDSSKITNKIFSDPFTAAFVQGQSYKFTLLLGMTSVKVEADETPWSEETNQDIWLPENEDGVDELIATNLVYEGTQDAIVIRNADDLAEARDLINDRELIKVNYDEVDGSGYYKVYKVIPVGTLDEEYDNFHKTNLYQVGNVDLSAYDNWEPIGPAYDNRFEGNYTVSTDLSISNLTITGTNGDYAGLFGCTTGKIENIRMESVKIGTETVPVEAAYAAAIAGTGYGTIKNCSVISGAIYGKQVAGLVANGNNTFFEKCSNGATVYGSGDAAGIYAGNGGLIEDCENTNIGTITSTGGYAAGITIYTSSITNARNSGNISGYDDAGGIAAFHNSTGSEIVASYNTGEIISTNGSAGGIVGESYGIKYYACYNTAPEITGINAGGIIGHWLINGSENALEAVMTSCYSTTGTITATDNVSGSAGALCGAVIVETAEELNSVAYTTCYYSNFANNAIGNDEHAVGITKVEGTWETATTEMNNNISGWIYSSESGAAPTLSVAP